MSVSVEGVSGVQALLAGLGDELKGVNERAQNKMAYELRLAEQDQMRKDIDRPTKFSVDSIAYKKFGESTFSIGGMIIHPPPIQGAGVFLVDRFHLTVAGYKKYLGVQIYGGEQAGPRASEQRLIQAGLMNPNHRWVAAKGTKLDAYGNIPGYKISHMITDLGTNPYARTDWEDKQYRLCGVWDGRFDLIDKSTTTFPDGRYFAGVFEKIGGTWEPFVWFMTPRKYEARYEFDERGDREVREKFSGILEYYLDQAMRNL